MRALMDEEEEADKAFWGQNAWGEGSEDDGYEFVSEKDSSDSDIDDKEVSDGEYGEVAKEHKLPLLDFGDVRYANLAPMPNRIRPVQ